MNENYAVFEYDNAGMVDLVDYLNIIGNEILAEKNKAADTLQKAKDTFEEANTALESAKAAVESAQATVSSATAALQSAAQSYAAAMSAWNGKGDPPSRASVDAAESALASAEDALAEAEEILKKAQETFDVAQEEKRVAEKNFRSLELQMENMQTILKTLRTVQMDVMMVEKDAVMYISNELLNLQNFDVKYGTKIAQVVEKTADSMGPGFTYVNGVNADGETIKVYADLYTGLDHQSYIKLMSSIGVDATMSIMKRNNCPDEQIQAAYESALAKDSSLAVGDVNHDGHINEDDVAANIDMAKSRIYADNVSKAEAMNVMSSGRNTERVYVDGKLVSGTLYVDPTWIYVQKDGDAKWGIHYAEGACATYAYATALSIKYGTQIDPSEISTYTSKNGYTCTNWCTDDGVYSNSSGGSADASESTIMEKIEEAVSSGDPILVHAGSHWVTITGYDASVGDYVCIDPYDGTTRTLSEQRGKNQFTGSLNEYVTL